MNETKYLVHHGIFGQSWGKKNGPPYPLDYNQHSAAEKRRGNRTLLSRYKNNNDSLDLAKKVLGAVAIAGAAYLYAKNSTQINAAVGKFAKNTVNTLKEQGVLTKGKDFVKAVGVSAKNITKDAYNTGKEIVTSDSFKASVKQGKEDLKKAGRKVKEVVTSDKMKRSVKAVGDTSKKVGKKAVQILTSEKTKQNIKTVGRFAKKTGKKAVDTLNSPEFRSKVKRTAVKTAKVASSLNRSMLRKMQQKLDEMPLD